ncbi:MAG: recombinase family protein [Methylomonas sp.]|nr:recombinase family protein [Methylomonas sp.]
MFSDKMTGSHMDRPGWDQLLEYARPGDTLGVSELSRMTRSLMDLLTAAKVLEQRQINLVSLRENIDTATATGRCFLSMMGTIHQMGRELRAERGKTGGSPKTDLEKLENARILYENSDKTAAEVCDITGVGRRKFFSYVAERPNGSGKT